MLKCVSNTLMEGGYTESRARDLLNNGASEDEIAYALVRALNDAEAVIETPPDT